MAEYDAIQRLAKVLDEAPGQLKVIHIKAHQDNKTPTEALSVPARLNVQADKLATAALCGNTSTIRAPMILGMEVFVHTLEGTIT